jgi:hypothetical protein
MVGKVRIVYERLSDFELRELVYCKILVLRTQRQRCKRLGSRRGDLTRTLSGIVKQ